MVQGMPCAVTRFASRFPDDVDSLEEAMTGDNIDPRSIIAILVKTDGNGELNDYSRQVAETTLLHYCSEKLGVPLAEAKRRITIVASSGCEGLVAPHGYVIYGVQPLKSSSSHEVGLSVGTARTPELAPGEIGTTVQVRLVAEATARALDAAQITGISDVGVVFVKGPVLRQGSTYSRTLEEGSGSVADPKHSIGLTRAACALGVAVGLGEIDEFAVSDAVIGRERELFSRFAFTFSGNELTECRVIVLGNSKQGNPSMFVASRMIHDLLDVRGVQALLRLAGIGHPGSTSKSLAAFFAKMGCDATDVLGGKRIALQRSDLRADRQVRAVLSGMLVPMVQDPEVFISSGAEHQGPPGGGIMAAVIRRP